MSNKHVRNGSLGMVMQKPSSNGRCVTATFRSCICLYSRLHENPTQFDLVWTVLDYIILSAERRVVPNKEEILSSADRANYSLAREQAFESSKSLHLEIAVEIMILL